MENILKDKSIVSVILKELSKYGNIPNDGFLCGGAVANTLMKLKWGGDYPINDLDIFVETKKDKQSRTPMRTDRLQLSADYWQLNASYNHGNMYRIVSSDRDGMINIVKVFRVNRDKSKNYYYILKGFDLNCTQVGVDLRSGELVYTKEFDDFLNDKQLKVVAPYTPAHTAVRLLKKLDELGCYCDVDSQMKLLSQPFTHPKMIKYDRAYSGVFAMFFGAKYKEMYEKYENQLKPYFRLVSYFDYKKTMWDKRWEMNSNETAKNRKMQHVLNWLDPTRSPSQNNLEHWASMNGKVWSVLPVKYGEPDKPFIDIIKGAFTPLTLISVWNMIYGGHKKTLVKKMKMVLECVNLKELCMVIEDFYDCDFSKKTVSELDKYVAVNRDYANVIYKYRLNVQEALDLKKDISKLLNKEGEWFSTMLFSLLKTNGHPMVKPDIESIRGLFEEEKIKLTKPIIEGIDLSGMQLPSDTDVKELVSEYDLAYAGKKLSNCINNPGQGYKEKIKKGDTKIFVITTPGSMSALEINKHMKDNVPVWRERWTLSYCNKVCNDYHRHISMYILSYVQKEMLLQDIAKNIETLDYRMSTSLKIMDNKQDTSTKDNPVSHEEGEGFNVFEDLMRQIANQSEEAELEGGAGGYLTETTTFDIRNSDITTIEPTEATIDVDYIRTDVVEVDEEQTTDRQPWDDMEFPF